MARIVLWVVTLLRVPLIPVFVWLGMRAQALAEAGQDPASTKWLAVGVLTVMGVSDVLDGWIARRWALATQTGAIVDAAADKLVQVALVTFFTLSTGPAYAPLPAWFLLALVGRDLVLGGGLAFAESRAVRLRVRHRGHGRVTSLLVFAVLGWVALSLPTGAVPALAAATAAVVVGSGWLYLWDGITQARVILRERAGAPVTR